MEGIEVLKENMNSAKISINAKGQYAGEIKVYAQTIDEAFCTAIHKANELENLIRSKNRGGIIE
jgi:hypothetical protein